MLSQKYSATAYSYSVCGFLLITGDPIACICVALPHAYSIIPTIASYNLDY